MAFVGRGINTVRTVGNQSVNGYKTFDGGLSTSNSIISSSDISSSAISSSNISSSNISSSTVSSSSFTGNVTLSKQGGISGGTIYFDKPDNTTLTGSGIIDMYGNLMRFIGKNSSDNYTTPLYLDLETGIAVANPSDVQNSVVTTMVIIKAGSGCIVFGNGLIIQWGTVGVGANFSVSFSTPFSSSASYGISVAPLYDNGSDTYALNVKYRTNTGFTGYLNANYNGASYIAIGY